MLIDQLVSHEGLRLTPYVDTVGKVTIGVGRNLTDKGISSREAFDMLDHDVDEAVADLAGEFLWFCKASAVRQRAVVDLRFNLGASGFRLFRKFIHAMAVEDYPTAGRELRSSRWANQVQPARRDRIVQMIEEGTDPCADS